MSDYIYIVEEIDDRECYVVWSSCFKDDENVLNRIKKNLTISLMLYLEEELNSAKIKDEQRKSGWVSHDWYLYEEGVFHDVTETYISKSLERDLNLLQKIGSMEEMLEISIQLKDSNIQVRKVELL